MKGVKGQVASPSIGNWTGKESLADVIKEIYQFLKILPSTSGPISWIWNCDFAEDCLKNAADYKKNAKESAVKLNEATVKLNLQVIKTYKKQ